MIARRAALAGLAGFVAPAHASDADDLRALYMRLVTAQNARRLDQVRAIFIDDPSFLWVSDGKSFWGRDVVLARMASYQTAKIWRVTPDLATARTVSVGDGVAYLHLSLDLTIGQSDAHAGTTPFLISMLCRRANGSWRIAALFTTIANPKA